MPKYYLHIRTGGDRIEDPDGTDLPDLDTARAEALAAARDILAERLRAGRHLEHEQFEICDEDGNILLALPLRNALDLK